MPSLPWQPGLRIPAIQYQPRAGAASELWFNASAIAHAAIQNKGRLFYSYAWPYNGTITPDDPVAVALGDVLAGVLSSTVVRGSSCRGYIEASWTHLVGYMIYSVNAPAFTILQLQVDDGTTTNTSPVIPSEQSSLGGRSAVAPNAWAADFRNDDETYKSMVLECPLSGLTLDQLCSAYLAAYSTDGAGGARLLIPRGITMILEMR